MLNVPGDQEWTLESARLALVPMTVSDGAELHELLGRLDTEAPIEHKPPPSLEELQARIRRWERRRSPDGAEVWLNWTLRLKRDQTAVGRMQATVTETRADMAWVIGPRFRNQGYATEAARCIAAWLMKFFKVGEVRAEIHPDNTASQRVAANIGMRHSGERTDDGDEVWTCRR